MLDAVRMDKFLRHDYNSHIRVPDLRRPGDDFVNFVKNLGVPLTSNMEGSDCAGSELGLQIKTPGRHGSQYSSMDDRGPHAEITNLTNQSQIRIVAVPQQKLGSATLSAPSQEGEHDATAARPESTAGLDHSIALHSPAALRVPQAAELGSAGETMSPMQSPGQQRMMTGITS